LGGLVRLLRNQGSDKKLLAKFFLWYGGCIFTKHTSFMLKNKVYNVIASVATIIFVVVIIISSSNGGVA
jgi:hypothetical protein